MLSGQNAPLQESYLPARLAPFPCNHQLQWHREVPRQHHQLYTLQTLVNPESYKIRLYSGLDNKLPTFSAIWEYHISRFAPPKAPPCPIHPRSSQSFGAKASCLPCMGAVALCIGLRLKKHCYPEFHPHQAHDADAQSSAILDLMHIRTNIPGVMPACMYILIHQRTINKSNQSINQSIRQTYLHKQLFIYHMCVWHI